MNDEVMLNMPNRKTKETTGGGGEIEAWCWWCCHLIPPSKLARLPIDYDEKAKQYVTTGQFCSVGCMKSYNNNSNTTMMNKYNINMLISRYIQECTNDALVEIPCAPPRHALKVFGGSMSIEEFRKNKDIIYMTFPPIRVVHYDIEKHQQTTRNGQPAIITTNTSAEEVVPSPKSDNSIENAKTLFAKHNVSSKVVNNPLKIKRKNEKHEKVGTIDNVLGMFQQQEERKGKNVM